MIIINGPPETDNAIGLLVSIATATLPPIKARSPMQLIIVMIDRILLLPSLFIFALSFIKSKQLVVIIPSNTRF